MWSLETPVAYKLGWLVGTATVIRSLHPRYPPTDMPFQDTGTGVSPPHREFEASFARLLSALRTELASRPYYEGL